jgi:hypothetical protein
MKSLNQTKLFQILSVINSAEWNSLGSFIESGVAGPSGRALDLYRILGTYHPHFEDSKLTREFLFESLYPEQNYNDSSLRYAMSDLFKQANHFLAIHTFQSNETLCREMLQEALVQRGAEELFMKNFKQDEARTQDVASADAELFYHRYRSYERFMSFYGTRGKKSDENYLDKVFKNLDAFFISKKLQLLCELVNVKNVVSFDYDPIFQDEIIRLVQGGAFADFPFIRVYHHILLTLLEPEQESHFNELKLLMESVGNLFSQHDLKEMYPYLMNYCIKKINLGVVEYVGVLFEIYCQVLERKVIFTDNHLSQWDFKNIVVIGIRAGKHQWVENFIETYQTFLPENERNNAIVYNTAYLKFSQGDYRQALVLLQRVEFTDLYYQLDMRSIVLKCYYEMYDEEALIYHLSAFRAFLRRNKLVSDYQRTIYRNLVKFTNRLLQSYGDEKKLRILQDDIEQTRQIADITWIRNKVKERIETAA